MAFDFPSSPTIGDSSNGYVWDGEKWNGGLGSSGPQTEQFFNIPAGVPSLDIPVPSWAQSCEVEGCIFLPAGNNWISARYSLDGTTFQAGATDYRVSGPIHGSGTNSYSANAQADTSAMTITNSGDQAAIPHLFTTNIQLTRPSTSVVIGMTKSWMRTYLSDAAYLQRTTWIGGYMNGAFASLGIKAIRFFPNTGTIAAGSFVKVKWNGEAALIPTSNAIPEAPQDGAEYVRVNGLWREKKRDFSWTLAAGCDIPVPAWNPKRARIAFFTGVTGSKGVLMRASTDGSTFISVANSYFYSGIIGQGTTVSYNPSTGGTFAWWSFTGDNVSVGHQGTFDLELEPVTNSVHLYRGIASCYDNAAGVLQRDLLMVGYLTGSFSGLRLKAIRLLLSDNSAPPAGARVSAEWH